MKNKPLDITGFLMLVINALEAAGVDYLIGGAIAGWAWGEPRATQDLDLVVKIPIKAINKLSKEKEQSGYYLEGQPVLRPEVQQVLKGSPAEWTNAKSIFTASYLLQNAFSRGVPSVIQHGRQWHTGFARTIRNCQLPKQIGWHYKERIANDEYTIGPCWFSQVSD